MNTKTKQNSLELSHQTKQQYRQLNINFNEFITLAPLNIEAEIERIQKLILPREFLEYPFFLRQKSEIVNNSRKTFNYDFANNYKTKTEKEEEPKVTRSDLVFRYKPINNNYASLSDDNIEFKPDFEIIADIRYGFPDDFDGQIYDIILHIISANYRQSKQFFQWYGFSINSIFTELQKTGYTTAKKLGGSLAARITNSLKRLNSTKYKSHFNRYDAETGKYNYIEYETFELIEF